jgi:hypothetical protein
MAAHGRSEIDSVPRSSTNPSPPHRKNGGLSETRAFDIPRYSRIAYALFRAIVIPGAKTRNKTCLEK